jgi:bifunctional enzyme Fae/Hps
MTMMRKTFSRLTKKQRYLQIAMNSTLSDASAIIAGLPASDRIIIEAGTPLIKRYGMSAVRELYSMALWRGGGSNAGWEKREVSGAGQFGVIGMIASAAIAASRAKNTPITEAPLSTPYIVADMKTIDRGSTEVEMCAQAGAGAVIAMGSAPIETLNAFIRACEANGIDAMIDMMNVEYPVSILRALKKPPRVVVLHRGVDEERDNKQKMLPLHEIRRVKGAHDILVAVAGGDTSREIQSAAFNDADIVVIWKSVYEKTSETNALVENFLKTIK